MALFQLGTHVEGLTSNLSQGYVVVVYRVVGDDCSFLHLMGVISDEVHGLPGLPLRIVGGAVGVYLLQ